MGLKYRDGGDSGRALIEFLKATREDPKLVEAYYEQALIFREKGFHKLASSRLEQALAIKPQYQKARLLLATIKLEQGKVSDAVEQLGTSLGLPKTAIKPDAGENESDEQELGVPPMILQSLHTALPLPAVPQPDKSELIAENPDDEDRQAIKARRVKQEAKSSLQRRKRTSNRRKVRELIARKYHKKQQRKSWIASIFSWPEPFKQSEPDEKTTARAEPEEVEEKKPASDLKQEFRTPEAEDKWKVASSDLSETRTKKNLIAYNGDPEDTWDIVNEPRPSAEEKQKRKVTQPALPVERKVYAPEEQAVETSSVVAKDPPKETEESFAIPSRKTKIASKGWLDYDAEPKKEKKIEPPKALEAKPVAIRLPVEDEWTKRLRYLAENGTSSLKAGEAFMFSEDTGEAVIFLADGQRIRRVIATPQETQEVLKLRRPDVLVPKELFFNTSLLGKVVNTPPPPTVAPELPAPSQPRQPFSPASDPPGFKIEQMMDNPSGFWNWFKGLVNL